jgi:hypothetical protein
VSINATAFASPVISSRETQTSLELSPPLPTLHPGPHPTHACLAFPPKKLILTMSLRDPADDRDMPPNGNDFVSALCLRGVRKVRTHHSMFLYYSLMSPLRDSFFINQPRR